MNHRDRVLAALRHQEPDRVPIDFGGTVDSTIQLNDGDVLLLSRVADGLDNLTLHGLFCMVELGGRRIAVNHYPPLARDQALSGRYDLVCHGHDHESNVERVGETLLVDPGEVMGRLGPSSYAVYDTETGQAELRQV